MPDSAVPDMRIKNSKFSKVLLLALLTSITLLQALYADEEALKKEEALKILKSAAAMNTKPNEFYEKIVDDLKAKGVLETGDMEKFDRAVSGMFNEFQTEDYHRLGLTLYSRGYEQEAWFILDKYVTPTKQYTPEEGLAKAKEKFDDYEEERKKVVDKMCSSKNDASSTAHPSSAPTITEKQPAWEKNVHLQRLILTNGELVEGKVLEKDEKGGVWLETSPGSKVYFSKSEYKTITDPSK